MDEVQLDFGQLRAAQRRLQAAGERLDSLGAGMPSGGDYGAAGPLVAMALGLQAEAGALLAAEAAVLGFAVGLCAADLGYTDAQQAVDVITIGGRP